MQPLILLGNDEVPAVEPGISARGGATSMAPSSREYSLLVPLSEFGRAAERFAIVAPCSFASLLNISFTLTLCLSGKI